MKYELIHNEKQEGDISGVDLLPIETFVSVDIKEYAQHFVFSELREGSIWTYTIELLISGRNCKSIVKVTNFTHPLGNDESYRTYGGGTQLNWIIDVEDDMIYYLQNLAAEALNYFISETMPASF
ncbi:MAG: hypothetical protein CL843_09355 [Crocinitomicaceae bacterium]|nr:hypothetical protein [Crocinitomicaceae bacterium]|tara:strand:+ start:467 stop:841 length:375 start_codon:yes stop_codon:yes gene_type:complete